MYPIRPYRLEELPLIIQRGLNSAWDQLVDRERLTATPEGMASQFTEMYRAVLISPGGALFVAAGQGMTEPPAGHALLYAQPNPFTGAQEVVVMDIWVHPRLRGMGIGSALLREAERHARSLGGRGLVAQVSLHNPASLALFRRAGCNQERAILGKGW